MSEAKETDGKETKSAKGKKTLSLKRSVESGRVPPSAGGGRKSVVVVEKKKKRAVNAPGAAAAKPKVAEASPKAVEDRPAKKAATAKKSSAKPKSTGGKKSSGGKGLSNSEMDARARVLAEAKVREEEERKQAVEQEKIDEERRKRETEEAAKRAAEEAERAKNAPKEEPVAAPPAKKVEEKPKHGLTKTGPSEIRRVSSRRPDKGSKSSPAASAPAAPAAEPTKERRAPAEARVKKPPVKPERPQPTRTRGAADRRQRGKLTITNALDDRQRERSLASLKRQRERLKKQNMGQAEPREKVAREVTIPDVITIQELANRMAERAVDVIKYLMKEGQMHKINDVVDVDTAELIVAEFGHTAKRVSEADVEEGFIGDEDDAGDLQPRAPIVTVMGHVDHGKTSLLDALRKANVVSGEAGGITQHIGAYQVETDSGSKITFIDTPGHAAFTAMRARGAKVTDIVVLVVAADDGVMPQTVEAINHAKAAEVPMIVAVNKIDKPDADPSKVRMDLLQHEVIVETMSGETLEVEVSALKGTNLDKLLDTIALQAELLELKANPDRSADGIVVEAKLERGRGPVGTVLIQRGTLHVGDIIVAGSAWGKVRALIDDHGDHVAVAGPAKPVEVLGFDTAPEAGDQFAVVENEARAREITEYRIRKRRDLQSAGGGTGMSLEQMMTRLQEKGKKEFNLLIKGDTQGSIEAIRAALDQLGNDEVAARIVHSGVGGITETDLSLAAASSAVLVGFNVRANAQARAAAEADGTEIRYYAVIYDLIDDVKAAMSGMLSPELRETFLGNAEILEVFNITKVGKVAGCRITEGKVERGSGVRLIRDNVVIHEGKLSTLKRFKDEVGEVVSGQECGMAFENYQDMRAGDVIECFHVEEVARSL